jgi:hypothetical protein
MISSIETAADVETAFNIAQSYSEIQAAGGQPVLNALSNFSPQGGAGTLEQTEQLLQAVSEKVQEAQANGVNIAENANQIAVQIVTQEMFNEGAQQALAQSPHVQEFIGNVISTVGPDSNLENTGALGGFIDKLNENPELITALNQNIANSPVTTQHILQQITGTSTSEDPQAAAAGGSEVFGTLIDAVNTPQDMEHLFGVAYMHYEIGQLNGGEAFLSNLQRPELQQAFSGENGISLSALDEGLRTLHGTIVQEGGDRNLLVKINNAMEGMSGQEIAEFAQQFAQNPQQTLQQMNMMLGIQEEINGFMQMFTMLGVTEEQMGGIIGMFQAGNWMEGLTQLFSAVVDGIQNMFSQGMDLLSQGTGGALSQMGATTEHRNPDGTPAAPSNETEDPSADREVAAAAVAPGSSPTG